MFSSRSNLNGHAFVCSRSGLSNFVTDKPGERPEFEYDEQAESDSDDEDSDDEDLYDEESDDEYSDDEVSDDEVSDDEKSAVLYPRAACPYCHRIYRKNYLSQHTLFACKANVKMEGAIA